MAIFRRRNKNAESAPQSTQQVYDPFTEQYIDGYVDTSTGHMNDYHGDDFPTTEFPVIRPEMSVLDYNGKEVRTNLPPELVATMFEPSKDRPEFDHPSSMYIYPYVIDDIPAGTYWIENPHNTDREFDPMIEITEDSEGGKYINAMRTGLMHNLGKNERLYQALGYQYDDDGRIVAFPSPITLERKAFELGLDIQLMPDQGLIDGRAYCDAFARGKYPLATGASEYYAHDTGDDHMTTMILGGDPLREALRVAAQEALDGKADPDKRASEIDNFTGYLRGTVSPTHQTIVYDYGRDTMHVMGKKLGLSPEKVDEIIESTRTRARDEFGMDVNELSGTKEKELVA